jgi:hypothetical protein
MPTNVVLSLWQFTEEIVDTNSVTNVLMLELRRKMCVLVLLEDGKEWSISITNS